MASHKTSGKRFFGSSFPFFSNLFLAISFCFFSQGVIAQTDKSDSLIIATKFAEAHKAFNNRKDAKALQLFMEVEIYSEETCDWIWLLSCYDRLAALYLRKMYNDVALEYLKKALILSDREFPPAYWKTGKINYRLAKVYFRNGEPEKALGFLRKSYSIFQKNPYYPEETALKESRKPGLIKDLSSADYYRLFGDIMFKRYQIDSSIYYYQKALSASEEMESFKNNSIFLNSDKLTNIYTELGDFEKAHETVIRAGEAIRKGENLTEIQIKEYHQRLYYTRGTLSFEESNYKDALHYFQQAAKFLSSRHDTLINCYQMIDTYLAYNDLEGAQIYLNKLQSISPKIKDPYEMTLRPYFEGRVLYAQRKYLECINPYKQGLELAKETGVPYTFNLLVSLGEAYRRLGDYPKAIRSFFGALNGIPNHRSNKKAIRVFLLQELGFTEIKNQQPERAIGYYNQALQILSPQVKNEDLTDVSVVKADQFWDYTLSCVARKAQSYYLLYKEKGDTAFLGNSVRHYLFASSIADNNRSVFKVEEAKLNWASNVLENNTTAIQAILTYGEVTRNPKYKKLAFSLADKNKAVVLAESFSGRKAQNFSNIPLSVLDQEKDIKREIAFYEKEIFEKGYEIADSTDLKDSITFQINHRLIDLKEEHLRFQAQIEQKYPRYFKLKYDLNPISVEETQALLSGPDETVLEYSIEDSIIHAFLISKDDYEIFSLTYTDSIENWVKKMLEGIYVSRQKINITPEVYHNGIKDYTFHASRIYDYLLAPIYKEKSIPKKLTIIPTGVLGYIPFDILLTEKPEKMGHFPDYQFLVKQTEISYAYSAKLNQEMIERPGRINNNKILAFAPSFPNPPEDLNNFEQLRKGYYSLTHNKKEVAHLEKIFPCTAYKDQSATKDVFIKKAQEYAIIHLATHAKVDDKSPDFSHIAFYFSEGEIQDGQMLTASEIYTLSLNAAMTVLSACETGLGKLSKGEGVLSMARAFAYAGAKSIVYSLWSVDDESTTQIMTSFYDHLGNGESKSEALRNAKLDYLQNNDMQHAHPFYWAAMVPIGDMSPLDITPKNNQTFWLAALLLGVLGLLVTAYHLGKARKS